MGQRFTLLDSSGAMRPRSILLDSLNIGKSRPARAPCGLRSANCGCSQIESYKRQVHDLCGPTSNSIKRKCPFMLIQGKGIGGGSCRLGCRCWPLGADFQMPPARRWPELIQAHPWQHGHERRRRRRRQFMAF